MKNTKIYAVRKGRKIGIFYTWNDCKNSVSGFPGAIYKSFDNEADAISFLNNEIEQNEFLSKDNLLIKENVLQEVNNDITVAFVDGSYEDSIKTYSYGSYILTKENNEIKEYELQQSFNDEQFLSSRNVSGEIFGVIKTLEWCLLNNKTNIKFYYDYEGIEKWANDTWQANTEISKNYKEFHNTNKILFNSIQFQKVNAHSGIEYNEKADKLAKNALKK